MAEDKDKISNGPNERARNEPIAGTAPGIPGEARTPCQELPEAPSDEEVEETAKRMGAPIKGSQSGE